MFALKSPLFRSHREITTNGCLLFLLCSSVTVCMEIYKWCKTHKNINKYIFFLETCNSLGRKTRTWIFVLLSLWVFDNMLRTLACYLYLYGVSETSPVWVAVLYDVTQWRRRVTLLPSDTFVLHMLLNVIHATRPFSTKCSNHNVLAVVLCWIMFEQS
jgi:hypothetical protein